MTVKVVLIGCVKSSRVALETLLELHGSVAVVGVMTRLASTYNSDFADLSSLTEAHLIPTLYVEEFPDDAIQADWLRSCNPDIVFCVGWSRLIGQQLLTVAPNGVVGFHPAELPANRGRHPIVWALVLGLSKTASSFF